MEFAPRGNGRTCIKIFDGIEFNFIVVTDTFSNFLYQMGEYYDWYFSYNLFWMTCFKLSWVTHVKIVKFSALKVIVHFIYYNMGN